MATDQQRSFGELLRQHRLAAGLSRRTLADKAGLSARGIQDLELGRRHPYLETARRLADALDVHAAERTALLSAGLQRRDETAQGAPHNVRVDAPLRRGRLLARTDELPEALTNFVGRRQEVLELRRLLSSTRLLTLTGAGGVGKTRLALQTARETADEYPAGTAVVELAAVADPAFVTQALATALGVSEQPGRPLLQTVLRTLRRRPVLIVLDNCEHLIQACAELAESVLRACPGIRILATSREPLDLGAEMTWRVPGLSLPTETSARSVETMTNSDAVRLFVQRARRARPDFDLTVDNASAVAQVCRRLDGMPLAIELAAARASTLTIQQIAQRLDDSLALLTGGGRTAPDRQRTLRGTLDWSYGLLSDSERTLLGRLAVFAGGWTLDAAEAVCGDDDLSAGEVLDRLGSLVNKSLVVAEERGPVVWYRLLDPLRAYALEKLNSSGDLLRVQSRHRDWYVQAAERFEIDWRGPLQRTWSDNLHREHANIRAALRYCLDRRDFTDGLRLAGALLRFWDLHGRLTEGRAWLAELLNSTMESVPDAVMAKALAAAGFLAVYQGDAEIGDAHLNEALRLWRLLGNEPGIAFTLLARGTNAQTQNDYQAAEALMEEGLTVARAANDRIDTYWALFALARFAARRGDYTRAEAMMHESLMLKRQQGDSFGIAVSLYALGQMAWERGEHERALASVRESLLLIRELRHLGTIAQDLLLLAHIAADRGLVEQSVCLFGAVEEVQVDLGDKRTAAVVLNLDPTRTEASLAACRARLTPSAFEAVWAAGQAMTTDEAVEYALTATAADRTVTEAAAPLDAWHGLTRREAEVLRLVANGNSNLQIATELVLSPRTVERHIANVYAKLGARNRVDATAYALRHGIA